MPLSSAPEPMLSFWYDFASTYSYPAAMRLAERAQALGVTVAWRPIILGPLMFEQQGLSDSPFNVVPVKGAHMWQDMARICRAEGLAFRRPRPFPQNSLRAIRLAHAAQDQPWIDRFTRAVYETEFVAGRPIHEPAVLAGVLRSLGLDGDHWLARAEDPAVKASLKAQVQEAKDLGLFGAPSFVVGREIFWGFDRMAVALHTAAARSSRAMGGH